MKAFLTLAAFCILLPLTGWTGGKTVTVDKSTVRTVRGVHGSAEVSYAFAAGDVVHITATSSKPLDVMLVIQYPEKVLGRVKFTKTVNHTFTMPEEGFVIIRFISSRAGQAEINYTVTRTPAGPATQNYDTNVTWGPEKDSRGLPAPKRGKG